MKIKYNKGIIIVVLSFFFIALSAYDFYIIKIKNEKQYFLDNNIAKKKTEEMHKNFNYSDILNTIEDCSPKFILMKIEKTDINKDFINTEVKYRGEMEGLIEGLKTMRIQEIIKDINEIKIGKIRNKEYTSEINVDFFKFK